MDPAVGLVQAYLYTNGYFTVTEYPILTSSGNGGLRSVTDLDVLAVRFPGAGRLVPGMRGKRGSEKPVFRPDPALRTTDERIDMIIGEVKEGRAELNRGARDPDTLRVALTRFGACAGAHADVLVDRLIRRGEAVSPSGPRVRLLAFGSQPPEENRKGGYHVVTLGHVIRFLRHLADRHWEIIRRLQSKDPAMSYVGLILKAQRGSRG